MIKTNDGRRGAQTPVLEACGLLFPVAVLAFGIEHIVFAGATDHGMYPWVLGPPAWNYFFGALLIALSVSIGIRRGNLLAAGVLGMTLGVYALVVYVPPFVAHLHDPGPWARILGLGSPLSGACELLAMSGVAWVLARKRMTRAGCLLFAGAMVFFGLQHLFYSTFLATLIPSWLPGHLFWEYFVGAAFLAAAAAIAADRAARLAAFLLGTMFGLFVLLLHVPGVVAEPGSRDQWTSALVAVAMCGGSFVLAAHSSRTHPERITG
jgi:hypothetical protein